MRRKYLTWSSIIKPIALYFLFCYSLTGYGQTISSNAVISLLTCDEGTELYNLYGHSAIRIKDVDNNIDVCFDWGGFTYGDSEIKFGFDFIQGKLDYLMTIESFENFMYPYHYEKRAVYEQILNVPTKRKQELWQALHQNYLPENRTYKYDFFKDNCATRIRDLLQNTLQITWSPDPDHNRYTFRELLDMRSFQLPWINFSMNLALGKDTDKKADTKALMFLPRRIKNNLENATTVINGQKEKAVIRGHYLYETPLIALQPGWINPTTLSWILLAVMLVASAFKIKVITPILDALFFSVMGFAGISISWLMLTSDHDTMAYNLNILWANPLNLLALIWIFSNSVKSKLENVFKALLIAHFAIILFWIMIPQEFPGYFKAFMIILVMKYYYWLRESREIKKRLTV